MRYLVRAQVDAGAEVTVGYLHDGPVDDLPDVRWHQFDARGNHDPRLLVQILRLVRQFRPDVIHTWILQMDVLGGVAAKLTRTAWVCREPSSAACYADDWKTRLRTTLVSRADAVVSNSAAGDRYWQQHGRRVSRHIIYNGLPLEAITEAAPVERGGLGVAEGQRLVVYAGRMDDRAKNLKRLLEAFAQVRKRVDARLILCGDGHDYDRVAGWIAANDLGDVAELTGHVDNVWSYMKAADLFVSVSLFEGRPNAVIEAMVCRAPLLVSDIEPHREFLDGDSAYFAAPEDTASIADAIVACLDDIEAARTRALAAEQLSRDWSIESMRAGYERVYAACLERRGA